MNDAEAFAYYDDPAKREPVSGVPRRHPDCPATRHVPVRFSAEAIEQVKRLAEAEGMTTSTWVRRAVEEKVRRELQNDERPRAQG